MGKEWETKNVNRKTDGYFTVEATLIMPVVLYVCIFIIYMGFYLYDKCVMKQDAYRAALTGSSIYRDDNQKVYNAASDRVVKLAADKYIATDYSYIITVHYKPKFHHVYTIPSFHIMLNFFYFTSSIYTIKSRLRQGVRGDGRGSKPV